MTGVDFSILLCLTPDDSTALSNARKAILLCLQTILLVMERTDGRGLF